MKYSRSSARWAVMFASISIGLFGVSACPSWLLFASCAAADIDSEAPPSFTAFKTANSVDLLTVNPIQAEFSGGSEALRVALRDQDKGARRSAAEALEQIEPEAKTTVPALRAALKDQDWVVRDSAADKLGEIGSAAKEAVPDLIAALGDQEASVRCSAAIALGKIGPEAKEAVPDLVAAALKDQDAKVRNYAVEALRKIQAIVERGGVR